MNEQKDSTRFNEVLRFLLHPIKNKNLMIVFREKCNEVDCKLKELKKKHNATQAAHMDS